MVSVIIPIYNRAHYIEECLESVLRQTYKNFEIIIIDDGSTDNLKEVLDSYFKKIKYIYKENGGVASARNVGIRHSSGDYIAWLDSDDRWLNFKLEIQVEILDKLKSVGFIHSDFNVMADEKGTITTSCLRTFFETYEQYNLNFNDMFSNKSTFKNPNFNKDIMFYWGNISGKSILGPMFLASSILVRKRCLDEIGLFNEKYKVVEDYDLWVRIAKKFDTAFLDMPTIEYRRFHPDQLSNPNMKTETSLSFLDVAIKLGYEDREFFKTNKKLVIRRLVDCYYAIASIYYHQNKYREVLSAAFNSIRLNFRQKKIYFYAIISMLKLFFKETLKFSSRSRKFVKLIFVDMLYYSRIIFILKNFSAKKGVRILTFHQISNENFCPLEMNIKISIFEALIKHLKNNYSIISMSRLLKAIKTKTKLPQNSIIFTFDDGYRDNYTNAYPILKKYAIPATIFLTVRLINKTESLWYDKIVCAIKNSKKDYLDLQKYNLGVYSLSSIEEKQLAVRSIVVSVKYWKTEERNFLVKVLIENLGVKECGSDCTCALLSWDEINEMADNGIEFGSHGMSHSILTTLSKEEADYEIRESKRIIREKTGKDVDIYAYPNGSVKDYNETIINLLRRSGYRTACTLIEGSNNKISPFELRRFCVTKGMVSGLFAKFSKSLFEFNVLNINS